MEYVDKKDAVATGLCQKPNRTRYAGLWFGSEEQQSECAISFVMKRKNSSQAIRRLRRVERVDEKDAPYMSVAVYMLYGCFTLQRKPWRSGDLFASSISNEQQAPN